MSNGIKSSLGSTLLKSLELNLLVSSLNLALRITYIQDGKHLLHQLVCPLLGRSCMPHCILTLSGLECLQGQENASTASLGQAPSDIQSSVSASRLLFLGQMQIWCCAFDGAAAAHTRSEFGPLPTTDRVYSSTPLPVLGSL